MERKQEVSTALGLTARQIKNWFQNRRSRDKRMAARNEHELKRMQRDEDESMDRIRLLQYERFRQMEDQKMMEQMRSWAVVKTESVEEQSQDYLDITLM